MVEEKRGPLRCRPKPVLERLAEYGWKPHRDLLAQKSLSRASIYWYMRETQRGTVSSNSRFQTVLFQQCSANLSLITRAAPILPKGRGEDGGQEAERRELKDLGDAQGLGARPKCQSNQVSSLEAPRFHRSRFPFRRGECTWDKGMSPNLSTRDSQWPRALTVWIGRGSRSPRSPSAQTSFCLMPKIYAQPHRRAYTCARKRQRCVNTPKSKGPGAMELDSVKSAAEKSAADSNELEELFMVSKQCFFSKSLEIGCCTTAVALSSLPRTASSEALPRRVRRAS